MYPKLNSTQPLRGSSHYFATRILLEVHCITYHLPIKRCSCLCSYYLYRNTNKDRAFYDSNSSYLCHNLANITQRVGEANVYTEVLLKSAFFCSAIYG